jgi:tetratricopeptide (TPR) repeat protein
MQNLRRFVKKHKNVFLTIGAIFTAIGWIFAGLTKTATHFNNTVSTVAETQRAIDQALEWRINIIGSKPVTAEQLDIDNVGFDQITVAKRYMDMGDNDQATKILTRALKGTGARTVARAQFYLGEIATAQLRPWPEILNHYQQAISSYPAYGAAYVGRAECLKRQGEDLENRGNFEAAKRLLQSAVSCVQQGLPFCDVDVKDRARNCIEKCDHMSKHIDEIFPGLIAKDAD